MTHTTLVGLSMSDSNDLFAWIQQMQTVSDNGFTAGNAEQISFCVFQNASS